MNRPSAMDAGALASDSRALDALKREARGDSARATRAAAKEFETLFMRQLLKSMREASPKGGASSLGLESETTKFYQNLADDELARHMTSRPGARGLGLADVIAKQLERLSSRTSAPPATQKSAAIAGEGSRPSIRDTIRAAPLGPAEVAAKLPSQARAFIENMRPHAERASRATGIPADYLIGQAALETGWGRRLPRDENVASSFNLFGIKASGAWKGHSVESTTTEFVDGKAQRLSERFRAYGSYAESFQDHATLLRTSPRYRQVALDSQSPQGFAQALQRAGYATDPRYAEKLSRVIERVQATRLTQV